MTIYTDQVTGKKYDRLPEGANVGCRSVQDYYPCIGCAFYSAEMNDACARAVEHCVTEGAGKIVFFIFKERIDREAPQARSKP